MIYEVKKDGAVFEIDDTVLFTDQPAQFRKVFNESLDENNMAVFDNATLILTSFGRVLINSIDE
ncbi:hypothetical protein D0T84_15975 [Dysgonomonas sp. 521]|uniref:hypothetical protein n=1 Tax=Dysgonomonas sp. 521 TaxID=2302932 RepID=UPI0013D7C144|nr:hypothetical protein [Dysgonomonas sp. 521]NDV96401.1 hypothetical protein [Dysgonomonas sp. 521]